MTVGQTDRQMDELGDGWTPNERGWGDIKSTKVKLQKSDKNYQRITSISHADL